MRLVVGESMLRQTVHVSRGKTQFNWMLFISTIGLSFVSCIAVASFLFIALSRWRFPFTVEWTEANMYLHVLQVLEGKTIYPQPSFAFVPTLYTPLYYYIAALFTAVTDTIMASMRLVSVLATLICFGCLALIGHYRRFSLTAKVIVVGLYAACYSFSGFWYDTAHVDSTFIAFILLAFVFACIPSQRHELIGVLSGLSICCAVATKQNALLALPFIAAWFCYVQQWRRAISFVATSVIGLLIGVWLLNVQSDSLFWLYVVDAPKEHTIIWELLFRDLWLNHMIPNFGWLALAVVIAFVACVVREGWRASLEPMVFAACLALPLIGLGITSMVKLWGYINGLMPVCAGIVFVAAQAYSLAEDTCQRSGKARLVYLAVVACIGAQFFISRYDIQSQIPSQQLYENGERIVELLREAPEPVFASTSAYLLHYAGKPTHFHPSGLSDITWRLSIIRRFRRSLLISTPILCFIFETMGCSLHCFPR
jgi:4-amino-4-deoxy-L-arabinose transferase-like glycosyltransferase